MTYIAILVAALLVLLAVCLVLTAKLGARHRDRAETTGRLETAISGEKSALRQLRLASHNLRAIGMTLQGHAEHVEAGGKPDPAGIANAAIGVLDTADYMHEWAEHSESTHVLNEEVLSLRSALDEAISTIARAIRPGQRSWNVDPEVLTVQLRADRRALRHVLMRALSVAARSTGHDHTIDIRMQPGEIELGKRAVELVIEGQAAPAGQGNPAIGGGSPDLRLTLAHALIRAHGGKLELDQRDNLSVHIAFPVERVVKSSDGARVPPTVDVTRRENDDRWRDLPVS
jgi:hypothetical protein